MTNTITLHIPAVPVAQPRARATIRGGHAAVYDDRKHPVTAFKATVRMALQSVYQGEPLTGPLRCELLFVMPRPKSLMWKTREMPRVPHISRFDLDNATKSVWDALNGMAFLDDGQICQVTAEKWIASGNEQPHAVITITRLEGEQS